MSSPTVVLVEDDPAMLSGVSELLQQSGLHVVSFLEFEEAHRYLQQSPPHAIVTDVRLGAFNGLHLVILAKHCAPEAAAFVYSAYHDPVIAEEAARCGAAYASKDEIMSVLVPSLLEMLGGIAANSV